MLQVTITDAEILVLRSLMSCSLWEYRRAPRILTRYTHYRPMGKTALAKNGFLTLSEHFLWSQVPFRALNAQDVAFPQSNSRR